MAISSRTVQVIGIGNEYRGDDALGLLVVRKLAERKLAGIEIIEASGEGTELIELMKDAPAAILVDAARSGAAAGTILRFEMGNSPLPGNFSAHSTHAFGIAEALEMARALNQLPPRLIVFGIEGQNFELGSEMSQEIRMGIEHAVDMISSEISNLRSQISDLQSEV